jgi:flagellar biosynthetic protein FlhB
MADSGEKKHPATESKLRKSREQGQWFSSPDLPAAATLAVGAILWSSAMPFFSDKVLILARSAWQAERIGAVEPFKVMEATSIQAAETAAIMVAMVMIAMFCVAGLIQFLQIGPMFSVKPLWNPTKLNPAEGFKKIFFTGKTYKKFALGMLKAIIMLGLAVTTVWRLAPNMFLAGRVGVGQTMALFNDAFSTFLYQAAVLSFVFGGADYMIQKTQFFNEQKMTDEELKDDMKQVQGNPEVKMHMRRMAMALMRGAKKH